MLRRDFNKVVFAGLLGMSIGTGAQATIIDHGSYLSDTASGLDWLDVTASVNLSMQQVKANFGSGGLYSGWRYATGNEFNQLVGNYTGNPVGGYGEIFQEPDLIDGLVDMLGSTFDSYFIKAVGVTYEQYYGLPEGTSNYTLGFIADQAGANQYYMAQLYDFDQYAYIQDFSWAHDGTIRDYEQRPDMGSYLVRATAISPIPEPSGMALVACGLLALVVAINRRHF